jgi:hypothetical protein
MHELTTVKEPPAVGNGTPGDEARERVLKEIRAYHAEHGRTPSSSLQSSLAGRAARLFGNWGNAVEAAGFPRPKRGGTGHRRPRRPLSLVELAQRVETAKANLATAQAEHDQALGALRHAIGE